MARAGRASRGPGRVGFPPGPRATRPGRCPRAAGVECVPGHRNRQGFCASAHGFRASPCRVQSGSVRRRQPARHVERHGSASPGADLCSWCVRMAACFGSPAGLESGVSVRTYLGTIGALGFGSAPLRMWSVRR